MMRHRPSASTVAVIGAGFSGTMTAVHLLRGAMVERPLRVVLIDRSGTWGRGIAYAATDAPLLLNVPARAMSALPDDPTHFLDWLRQRGAVPAGGAFVPRSLYGEYLVALLAEAAAVGAAHGSTLQRVAAEAVSLEPSAIGAQDSSAATIRFAGGGVVEADRVVLAVGNFPPSDPPLADPWFYRDPRYVGSPWSPAALTGLAGDVPVLVVGSGLTMFDIVTALMDRGHEAPIHVLSRRGLLPNVHRDAPDGCVPSWAPQVGGARRVRELMRILRAGAAEAEAAGCDWRVVLDALRPQVQLLWRSLPPDERRRFLRHARPYWEVHRHRLAPEVLQTFDDARRAGRVELHTGSVGGFGRVPPPGDDLVDVDVALRGGGRRQIRVGRVINSTGPTSEYRKLEHPLVRGLLGAGIATPDPLHLGLETALDGALVGVDGLPSRTIFAIGPVRKGSLWESTAVPELREQARDLARTVARSLDDQQLVGEVRLELTRRSRGTGS